MTDAKIKVDLNRISRRELNEWKYRRKQVADEKKDEFDFVNLSGKVIIEWPHGDVTLDNYLDLGVEDSAVVDRTITEALEQLGKKK